MSEFYVGPCMSGIKLYFFSPKRGFNRENKAEGPVHACIVGTIFKISASKLAQRTWFGNFPVGGGNEPFRHAPPGAIGISLEIYLPGVLVPFFQMTEYWALMNWGRLYERRLA